MRSWLCCPSICGFGHSVNNDIALQLLSDTVTSSLLRKALSIRLPRPGLPNLGVPKNHWEGLLKHRLLGLSPRDSDSVGLGWDLRIWVSNKLPNDAFCSQAILWVSLLGRSLFICRVDGTRIGRSGQTPRTRSISASWCHAFEYLSPESSPPWSLPFSSQTGLPCPPRVTWDALQLAQSQTTKK